MIVLVNISPWATVSKIGRIWEALNSVQDRDIKPIFKCINIFKMPNVFQRHLYSTNGKFLQFLGYIKSPLCNNFNGVTSINR